MSIRERIAGELEAAAKTLRSSEFSSEKFLGEIRELARDVEKDLNEAWEATEEIVEKAAKDIKQDFKAGCQEATKTGKEWSEKAKGS